MRSRLLTRHDSAAFLRVSAALPAVLAIVVGVFFVYGAGFAHPESIHNAAHDGRHAFAFPCH